MKKYSYLIIFSIFAVPMFGWLPVNGDVWYAQFLGLFLVLFFGMALKLWEYNKYMAIFSMVCLFSCVFVTNHHPRSIILLGQLNLSLFAVQIISQLDKTQRRNIVRALIVLFVIQAVYVCVQYLNNDPFFRKVVAGNIFDNLDDTVGLSGSHNQIGLFFADTAPLVLGLCPYLIPLSIFGLWNATTTAAWTGFICSTIFYFSFRPSSLSIVLAFILAIGSAIFFNRYENLNSVIVNERVTLWRNTIKQVNNGRAYARLKDGTIKVVYTSFDFFGKKHNITPLVGYGFGDWIKVSPKTQKDFLYKDVPEFRKRSLHVYEHAHNDLIEVFFELGWVGLISILALIWDFTRRFALAHKTKLLIIYTSGMLAHFITSLGVYTVHTAISGMLIVLLWGLAEGEMKEPQEKDLI